MHPVKKGEITPRHYSDRAMAPTSMLGTAHRWICRRPASLPELVFTAIQQPIRCIVVWWYISMWFQHEENTVKSLLQAENFPGMPELFKRLAETLRWSP